MHHRRSSAWLFLGLLAIGVLWPAAAGTVRCGDCCHTREIPSSGFSLCCFHSVSTPPTAPLPALVLAESPSIPPVDEEGGPPPDPRGVLHVPRPA